MAKHEMEHEAVERIKKWLAMIFPENERHPPLWNQEPYKGILFDIFAETYPTIRPHGNRIIDHLKETWRKDHSKKEWETLWDILAAWDEWLYAWERHPSTSREQ
jgi:hypothetical protein